MTTSGSLSFGLSLIFSWGIVANVDCLEHQLTRTEATAMANLLIQLPPFFSSCLSPQVAFGLYDVNVHRLIKAVATKKLISAQKSFQNFDGHCIVLGLNFDSKTICGSASNFTFNSRTALFINHDKTFLKCSNLGLNSNIFGYDFIDGKIQLHEVYKANGKAVDLQHKLEGARLNSLGFIGENRNNLHQMAIRIKVFNYPPFFVGNQKPTGILVEMMNRLGRLLNFTSEYFMGPPTETSDEFLPKVSSGEYHLGLSLFRWSQERALFVNFGTPFFNTRNLRLIYCHQSNSVSWTTLLLPLNWDSWLSVVIYIILMTTFTATTYFCVHGCARGHFEDSLGMVLITSISKRVRTPPGHKSGKILMVTGLFTGFVFLTMYKTMLSAILAVDVEKPPVESLNELLLTSKKIYVNVAGPYYKMFSLADKNDIFGKLFEHGNIDKFEFPVKMGHVWML